MVRDDGEGGFSGCIYDVVFFRIFLRINIDRIIHGN